MLTQKRLKEVVNYNPETGIFTRKIRLGPGRRGAVCGYKTGAGYLSIGIDYKKYLCHRLAWLYVYGYMPEGGVDHIDRNGENNAINNLRLVNQTCNARNTGNQKNTSTGVKGVSWRESRGVWRVHIKVNFEQKFLGHHKDFHEAVAHRLAGEQCLGWGLCDKSSPAYKYIRATQMDNRE